MPQWWDFGPEEVSNACLSLGEGKDALHLCADPRNGSIKVMVVDEVDASV